MRDIVPLFWVLALACHHLTSAETQKTKVATPTNQTEENPPTPATLPVRAFSQTSEKFEYRRSPLPYAMVFDDSSQGPLLSYVNGDFVRWNIKTNAQEVMLPKEHYFIGFSLDGALGVAAIPPEGARVENLLTIGAVELELWDLRLNQKKLSLSLPVDPLQTGDKTLYTPGTLFASGQNGLIVNVPGALFWWDFSSNTLKSFELEPNKPARNVRYYCVSPDGKTLIAQTKDNNTLYLFSLPSLRSTEKLSPSFILGSQHLITVASFDLLSSSEFFLLSVDEESDTEDARISIWDLKKKKLLKSWPIEVSSYSTFFLLSLDKRWALFYETERESSLSLVNLGTGEKRTLAASGKYTATFSFDSRSLAAFEEVSGNFYLWDLSDLTAPALSLLPQGHLGSVSALVALRSGMLFSGALNGELKLWDLTRHSLQKSLDLSGKANKINDVVLSLNEEEALLLSPEQVSLLQLSQGTSRAIPFADAISAAFSSDGKTLFFANTKQISAYTTDGTALWSKETKDSKALIPSLSGMVFAPNTLLAALGHEVYTLNPTTGEWEEAIVTHLNKIVNLALSSDQKLGASITETGSLRIFQSTTGKTIQKIETSLSAQRLQFSPDGREIAVLGETPHLDKKQPIQRRLILWDIKSGQQAAEISFEGKELPSAFTFLDHSSFWLGFNTGALRRYTLEP